MDSITTTLMFAVVCGCSTTGSSDAGPDDAPTAPDVYDSGSAPEASDAAEDQTMCLAVGMTCGMGTKCCSGMCRCMSAGDAAYCVCQ